VKLWFWDQTSLCFKLSKIKIRLCSCFLYTFYMFFLALQTFLCHLPLPSAHLNAQISERSKWLSMQVAYLEKNLQDVNQKLDKMFYNDHPDVVSRASGPSHNVSKNVLLRISFAFFAVRGAIFDIKVTRCSFVCRKIKSRFSWRCKFFTEDQALVCGSVLAVTFTERYRRT